MAVDEDGPIATEAPSPRAAVRGRLRAREDEILLTIDQVAEIFQVSVRSVRTLVYAGKLQSTRVCQMLRFKRAWLDDYLKSQQQR
jgi:excisionase family DNA binding protein